MPGGSSPPEESGRIDLIQKLVEVSHPSEATMAGARSTPIQGDTGATRAATFRNKAHSFWKEQNMKNRSKEAGHGLQFHNGCYEDDGVVVEDLEWESSIEDFGFALVGFVCGSKPNLGRVKGFARTRWGPEKDVKVAQLRDGVFLFKFSTKGKMDEVLEGGPWSYENRPFLLKEWNPDEQFELNKIEKIHTWVRFPELLPNLWRPDILSKIASVVGKPIRTDAFTAQGEKLMYARVLLEISAKNPLKRSVKINCPGGRSFNQIVQYEWTPPCCEFCQVFGHNMKSCDDYTTFMADKEEPENVANPAEDFCPDEIIAADTKRLRRLEDRGKLLVGEGSRDISEDSINSDKISHVSPTQSQTGNSPKSSNNNDQVKLDGMQVKDIIPFTNSPNKVEPLAIVLAEQNPEVVHTNRFDLLSDEEVIRELERVEQNQDDNFTIVTKKSTLKKMRREEQQGSRMDNKNSSNSTTVSDRSLRSRANGSNVKPVR